MLGKAGRRKEHMRMNGVIYERSWNDAESRQKERDGKGGR